MTVEQRGKKVNMLPPTPRETSSTGQTGQRRKKQRDEDNDGKKQGGGHERSCRKDWFKESRVTTDRHHLIRPLFHKAGRAGRECGLPALWILWGKKQKEIKEKRGGRERKPAVSCCQMSLWVWRSVTAPRTSKNNGRCRGRNEKFQIYFTFLLAC